MMPIAGVPERVRVAPAPLGGVSSVTELAQRYAALERPIAQQTGHDEREGAETGPPGRPFVAGARAGLISATTHPFAVDPARAAPVHAVIEQSFHTAQTGSVIEDSVRGAEALVVAQPFAGQRRWFPAGFAAATAAEIAHYRETGRVVSPGGEAVRGFLSERDGLFRHGVRRRCVHGAGRGGRVGRVRV